MSLSGLLIVGVSLRVDICGVITVRVVDIGGVTVGF